MSSQKANPNLQEETNVNVNDPNKTSGTSPPNDNRDSWQFCITRGDSLSKLMQYNQARQCYADACETLGVGSVDDVGKLNSFHPALLMVLLHFANFEAEFPDSNLIVDVHTRLARVLKGLLDEYKGLVQVETKLSHECLGKMQTSLESFINAASRWRSQLQPVPQPWELEPQHTTLRKYAQQVLTAFDTAHAPGKALVHLRNTPPS
jgi:hypothetical protein